MSNALFVDDLAEPLNGAKTANFDIDAGVGNLTIDRLSGNDEALATGTLQYFEKQGPPNAIHLYGSWRCCPQFEREACGATLAPTPVGGMQWRNRLANPLQPVSTVRHHCPQWRG